MEKIDKSNFCECTSEEIIMSEVIFTPYVPLQATCPLDIKGGWEMEFNVNFHVTSSYKPSIEEILDYINEGPI